jgi:biopolymer transport protein ExbB
MSSIVFESSRRPGLNARACKPVAAMLLPAAMLAAALFANSPALAQDTVAPPATIEQPAEQPAPQQPAAPAPMQAPTTSAAPSAPNASDPAIPDELAPEIGFDTETEIDPRDSTLPHDLSPWGMFMAADWVVKAVMIGLAFASLITWTVWLAKTLELAGARASAGRGLKRIIQAESLPDAVRSLDRKGGPAALMVRAAAHEMEASRSTLPYGGAPGLKERVTSHLSRIEAQAGRRMTRGTGVLATIGSTAPFVGLFGTVWGIMNSFIGISEAQTTNLAVVAPGIAEALLATALGLVAAIPAVVIYNVFARSISGYRLLLADAAAAVERLVSRDIDRRAVPEHALPRAAE